MSRPVLVSGIQPTGNLHLGNYLGAVKNWVDLQNSGKYEMYIFIADLHALTGNLEAEQRQAQVQQTAAELLAIGLDPEKTTLFIQSQVPGHTELGWIFSCLTPLAELQRMTQYKDKSRQQAKNINAGLLTYPILQAADILLYRGTVVPVGQDQVQHVELTRDIGRWFNQRYGEYFSPVNPLLTAVPRVMSLLEPDRKMSKSLGAGQVIELGDDPETIIKKLKKAVTATTGGKMAPGVANLLLLLKSFERTEEWEKFVAAEKDGTIRYGDLKTAVAETLINAFADFRQKKQQWLDQPEKLGAVLQAGAKQATVVATETLTAVRERVGIN
ncbi:MAG TPA: tryptophan--tRNA ligase [Patescibacteria group bacterium]|nr:tryptophan--tRNA ligase [Patescibacteria group bacterium]